MIVLYVFFKVVQSGPGLGLASILVNFLQTILVIRDLQLKWTLTFHSVLNVLSVINFNVDLVSPECFITTESFRFSLKMKLVLLIPIILVSILALFVVLHSPPLAYIFSKLKRMVTLTKGNSRSSSGVVSRQIIPPAEAQRSRVFMAVRAFNLILSVLYIMVATQSLALFDCTKEADNYLYLDADVSLRCYENWWWKDFPLAVAAVIVYVIGIPVYYFCLFYILYQNKHRSPRWQRWKKIIQKVQDTEYAFLKPEYQYFVFLQIIFKLAIIAVRMFFTSYITLQIALTLAILLGSFILYWSCKPYAYNMLNFVEVQSTIHSMIILMLGLLFYNEQFKSEEQKTMITFVTLFFVFSFVLSVILCGLYGMRGSFNRFKASIGRNAKKEGGEEKGTISRVHEFPVRSVNVRNREMKSSGALDGTRSPMLMGSSLNLLQ
ncbi:hypothetical protein BKA69DRAFT_68271 [Paraphysoderma sedebokerense]|nr:hypothetical protein BKA69DRAFT_68271 [Paraphysoderma sedebokerense]